MLRQLLHFNWTYFTDDTIYVYAKLEDISLSTFGVVFVTPSTPHIYTNKEKKI